MRRSKSQTWQARSGAAGLGLVIIGLWWLLARRYPVYILPAPGMVWQKGIEALTGGNLAYHFAVTAGESLAGFAAGAAVALPFGYLLGRHRWMELAVSPYLVASQAVPIVALAPLLIIWFGFGLTSKVLIAALVAFFPVVINMVVGMRQIGVREYELMQVMGADRWQTFVKLEMPGVMPVLFAGFRMGLALSVIGAVVGEFASSDRGLGYLVNVATGMLDTPLLFVALFSLALLGISFHLMITWLERTVLPWNRRVGTGQPGNERENLA